MSHLKKIFDLNKKILENKPVLLIIFIIFIVLYPLVSLIRKYGLIYDFLPRSTEAYFILTQYLLKCSILITGFLFLLKLIVSKVKTVKYLIVLQLVPIVSGAVFLINDSLLSHLPPQSSFSFAWVALLSMIITCVTLPLSTILFFSTKSIQRRKKMHLFLFIISILVSFIPLYWILVLSAIVAFTGFSLS